MNFELPKNEPEKIPTSVVKDENIITNFASNENAIFSDSEKIAQAKKALEAIRRIQATLDEALEPYFPIEELRERYLSVQSAVASPERLQILQKKVTTLSRNEIARKLETDLRLYKKAVENAQSILN